MRVQVCYGFESGQVMSIGLSFSRSPGLVRVVSGWPACLFPDASSALVAGGFVFIVIFPSVERCSSQYGGDSIYHGKLKPILQGL